MNRRDLLLFRTTPQARVVELRCEQLYLEYFDLRRRRSTPIQGVRQREDYWLGEPSPDYETCDEQTFFADIAGRLRRADVLRISGRDWLCDEELARRVEQLIDDFTANGGRVEQRELAT